MRLLKSRSPIVPSRSRSDERMVAMVCRGFTLTEMLVATAITVMILLIFAQIYRAATTTIIEQRGIAQNDARARMLSTLIRGDLQKCSYRQDSDSTSSGIVPLTRLDVTPTDLRKSLQSGYVYMSENDIDNDVDDVLQLTVRTQEVTRSRNTHPYIGKASRIGRPSGATGQGSFNINDQNQPEFDDGDSTNGAMQSQGAEIVYFVRNGVLYRRVLLLREPLTTPTTVPYNANPQMELDALGGDLIPGIYDNNADLVTPTIGDFWNDFDSSAICLWNDLNGNNVRDPSPTDSYQVQFNSLFSLGPTSGTPLGLQKYRFGFNPDGLTTLSPLPLRPREYTSSGQFLGRFTHEETSNENFGWPGNDFPNASHPYKRTDLTLNTRGAVTQYQNGPRISEDVLLPNVDGFDVKVWDPAINQFVDLGYARSSTLSPGYFDHHHNLRRDYGPRFVSAGADGQPGVSGVDDDGDGTTDNPSELGWPGSDDVINRVFDTWHSDADVEDIYSADDTTSPYDPSNGGTGTNFFPAFRPLLSMGPNYETLDSMTYTPPYEKYVDWAAVPDPVTQNTLLFPYGDDTASIGYLCTQAGAKGGSPPTWPTVFSQYINELAPGTAVWQVIDNRVGLTMIQITIRYRDVGSNLPRQLTIVHSFAD